MREITPTTQNKLAENSVMVAHFVRIDFPEGILALHTGVGPISFGGDTYYGVGQLGGIEVIKEAPDVRPQPLRFYLSGLDASIVTQAINDNYHGRRVDDYIGVFDPDLGQLVDDPFLVWSGNIVSMEITLDKGTGTITVQADSNWADWNRINGARYTNEEQQSLYPGDPFFEFVHQIQDREVQWSGVRVWFDAEKPRFRQAPGENKNPNLGGGKD